MNEFESYELNPEFAERLQAHYTSPSPASDFIEGLEGQLRQQHAKMIDTEKPKVSIKGKLWGQLLRHLEGRTWQVVAVAVLLAMIITTLAIGPGRVLAQVQQWLGYVPGFGFVDLERTRILVEPVTASREGVSVKVEQMLAEPDRTRVILSVQGLPPQRQSWLDEDNSMQAALRLPNGGKLLTKTYQTSFDQDSEIGAVLDFPRLPENAHQVTLEIDHLPYVRVGAAPENWQIPLILAPASSDPPKGLLAPSFRPPDASTSANGVTVRILQVAYSQAETALQVQFEWRQPDWVWSGTRDYSLTDDVGHGYQFPSSSSGPVEEVVIVPPGMRPTSTLPIQTTEQTYQFAPLSQAANQATFSLEEIQFILPAHAVFTFDPGPAPQPGRTWSLDKRLQIAGFDLHFTEARLTEERPNDPNKEGPVYYFEFPFQVEGQPDSQADGARKLEMVSIDGPSDSSEGLTKGSWINNEYSFAVGFEVMPDGPIEILIDSVYIAVPGPWEISWEVPKLGDSDAKIRTLYPENAMDTQWGVSLQAEKVILSDRLSVIDLDAPDLPQGMKLLEVSAGDPRVAFPFREGEVSLHDQSGQALEPHPDVYWLVDGEQTMGYDPDYLQFAPVGAATESLTLRVPGVELFVPGEASFDVSVPEGLQVRPEEYRVKLPEAFYPDTERTLTRWTSEAWPVDLSVDIAGYKLYFDQAHLERKGTLSDRSYRLVLTGDPVLDQRDGRWLSKLQFADVSRPDGSSGTAFGGVRFQPAGGDEREAFLTIEVTMQDGDQALPGDYRVVLDGVIEWVPGPWELSLRE